MHELLTINLLFKVKNFSLMLYSKKWAVYIITWKCVPIEIFHSIKYLKQDSYISHTF